MVFVDDFLRDVAKFESKILGSWEWGHKVEIGYVHGHELGSVGGNDAVKQKFSPEHVGHWCGHFTGVIDSVATHCEASAVGFSFFRV